MLSLLSKLEYTLVETAELGGLSYDHVEEEKYIESGNEDRVVHYRGSPATTSTIIF